MNPLLVNNMMPQTIQTRIASLQRSVKMLAQIIILTVLRVGPWQRTKQRIQREIERGQTIWLDDLEPSQTIPSNQFKEPLGGEAGDMTPNQGKRPRKSRIMKLDAYPEPTYPFAYRNPPLSGNVINGLGETETRPAYKVFHSNSYKIAWSGLEKYYHVNINDISIKMIRKIRWLDRDRRGPVAPERAMLDSPGSMAALRKT